MSYLRKWGTATVSGTHIGLPMPKAGSADFATSGDWTPVSGDVYVSLDNGTPVPIATLPVYSNRQWVFALSSGETSARSIQVIVSDSAPKAVDDQFFTVETFGSSGAMYAYDPTNGVGLGLTAFTTLQNTLTAISGYVDELESRLTATRAGYLDALSGGVGGGGSSGDWTATERAQIRHRLGLDGAVNTPTGTVNLGTLSANVVQVSDDATAADNLEAAFDGTGYLSALRIAGVTGNVTGNVLGNLSGSVAGNVNGNVGGNVVGSIGSLPAGAITSGTLAESAVARMATGVWDLANGIETGETPRQVLRAVRALNYGVTNQLSSTQWEYFRKDGVTVAVTITYNSATQERTNVSVGTLT